MRFGSERFDPMSHYIKEWRKHRGLSLRRLAERMESEPGEELISSMSLSRIERGQQPYSEPILSALAHALDTTEWALLTVNPEKDGDVVDFMQYVRSLSKEERERAMRILRASTG